MMNLVEVTNKRLEKDFLLMPLEIYKNDPNYIRPLDQDILNTFNRHKNKAYRYGETRRWLLVDENENYIGRIAAFTNSKYTNKGDDQPTGGVGFFECIDNQEAADMLFDVSKNWLIQKGMEAMDGPINFGERDRWWGLVVEGFMPPLYLMNYNPPYYQALFENYGFKPFFHQICYAMKVNFNREPRFDQMYEKYSRLPDFEIRTIKKDNIRRFAIDFCKVYNAAWAGHAGNKNMNERVAFKMFKVMKPVIDERIIWFVYYKNEPIAFFINLPELNSIFKNYNGRFGLYRKLHFWLSLRRKNLTKMTGLVFGVVPEFHGKGIDYYMITNAANELLSGHFKYIDYEMQWIGDFNPRMMAIADHLTATPDRKLTTYRYLFDRTKEFKRHPILG